MILVWAVLLSVFTIAWAQAEETSPPKKEKQPIILKDSRVKPQPAPPERPKVSDLPTFNPLAEPEPIPPLVLNEICFLPAEGEPEWIEIYNAADTPVDLKGWRLLDGIHLNVVISEKPYLLPPASYLVLSFDTAPKGTNTPHVLRMKAPDNMTRNYLGDEGGCLALSAPTRMYEMYKIRDYIAWGYGPTLLHNAASQALYPTLKCYGATVEGSGRGSVGPDTRIVKVNCSIGRINPLPDFIINFNNWGIFNPTETTPGIANPRRMVQAALYATKIISFIDQGGEMRVIQDAGVTEYEFQLASDHIFANLIIDTWTKNPAYSLKAGTVPPGATYHWRARVRYRDGFVSAWSPTYTITSTVQSR